MALLLSTFTFDRNAFKRTAAESASSVVEHIKLVQQRAELDKASSNIVGALTSYMGVFTKGESDLRLAKLGEAFLRLYAQNIVDAWQWLIARSLWRFVIPNGTNAKVNEAARRLRISFNFFSTLLGLVSHLQTQPGEQRFLYYDEICGILKDDQKWTLLPHELFLEVLSLRKREWLPVNSRRPFLEDLEPAFDIPRDNFHGLFRKALQQTGLFEYKSRSDRKEVGIALSSGLDQVLQRRVRFILDHPPTWDENAETWTAFLELHSSDLPEEASLAPAPFVEEKPAESLEGLVAAAHEAFKNAHYLVPIKLIHRFAASLLAKRFVILTGVTGSGKTKLAHAFASWLSPQSLRTRDCFAPGTEIKSDRITYYVKNSDSLSIEFWNSDDESGATKVVLPRELIREWAEIIKSNAFDRSVPARRIREMIKPTSQYSSQISSFETHLKASAFALIEAEEQAVAEPCFRLIPVGADWTSKEHILGYPDALNETIYHTTPPLDLLLQAESDTSRPYFLILDEMNLSHVERYFADLLSAMESGEPVPLHSDWPTEGRPARGGVPRDIVLPPNLFVIGTVNIDETTYMFSPKVLDRANVIEFTVSEAEMKAFIQEPQSINMEGLIAQGQRFGQPFVSATRDRPALAEADRQKLDAELILLFRLLSQHGGEFGFRVAAEMSRFVHFHKVLTTGDWPFRDAMDAQVVQKILPKLHGSRRKLEPLLSALGALAYQEHRWQEREGTIILGNEDELLNAASEAAEKGLARYPLYQRDDSGQWNVKAADAFYPLALDKIRRMLSRLEDQGFTSFAEA